MAIVYVAHRKLHSTHQVSVLLVMVLIGVGLFAAVTVQKNVRDIAGASPAGLTLR